MFEVALRVENRTVCAEGLDRAGALARSLLSTHPVLRVAGGRFISPLERPCASVNTFPVLATAGDDAVLGAAIVLPDHPQIAPESRGGLFDSTEIEEALLLHVKTLSDAEREEIERADPAVRDMVGARGGGDRRGHLRASRADDAARPGHRRSARAAARPCRSQRRRAPGRGRRRHVPPGRARRLRPGPDADLHARLLDGRTATIERIFVDYDGKTHLGVTIDDDPGQELMRETNRFLFFFAPEVEVIEP